jgi:hypothetical protein
MSRAPLQGDHSQYSGDARHGRCGKLSQPLTISDDDVAVANLALGGIVHSHWRAWRSKSKLDRVIPLPESS